MDRVLQSVHLPCVGPGHDEEIPTSAGIRRGPNLLRLLVHWNDPFALHVSATLGPDLILQEHAGRAGVNELVHRADDVEGIAIPRVRVDDDGNAHRAADPFRDRDHFGLGEVPEVRHAELSGRHAVARDKRQREAGLLHQLRAQGIIDAGEDQRPFLFQQGMNACRDRHVGIRFSSALRREELTEE